MLMMIFLITSKKPIKCINFLGALWSHEESHVVGATMDNIVNSKFSSLTDLRGFCRKLDYVNDRKIN